jgi:hypothetical protein
MTKIIELPVISNQETVCFMYLECKKTAVVLIEIYLAYMSQSKSNGKESENKNETKKFQQRAL